MSAYSLLDPVGPLAHSTRRVSWTNLPAARISQQSPPPPTYWGPSAPAPWKLFRWQVPVFKRVTKAVALLDTFQLRLDV